MATARLHEADGRFWSARVLTPTEALETLAMRFYHAALVTEALAALERRDFPRVLEVFAFMRKGDFHAFLSLGIDVIDRYCDAAGVEYEEVRGALRAI